MNEIEVEERSQETYLPIQEVCKRYAVGRTTVYDWRNSGIIPPPYRLGPKLVRWKLSELVAWEARAVKAPYETSL